MKYKYIIGASILLGGLFTSCIDETFPSDDTVTDREIDGSSTTALQGFARGIVAYLTKPCTVYGSSTSVDYDLGYPSLGMIRDMYTSDFTVNNTAYDYFYYWESGTYLGSNYATAFIPWNYYYQFINNTHNILRIAYNEENKEYFGYAHFYRAMAYLDMARLYEFKNTGIEETDQQAADRGIYGLTVPIITESTTEEQSHNTPRATFYDMYRFILDDLEAAEQCLDGVTRTTKDMPDEAAINGLKARLYLELGTRLEQNATDEQTLADSGVDLGASTATEAYKLALECAEKAISLSGATPLSESEWYGGSDYTGGFNNMNTNAWMLGVAINKEDLSTSEWRNFIGHMSPEQYFGVGGILYNQTTGRYVNTYGAQRIIGAQLFNSIDDSDWRKLTWVDPDDAGDATKKSKYKTNVADGHFEAIPAYASFKFRPKNGEKSDYSTAAAIDYPLMRVEEMYFIAFEAKAAMGNVGAAVNDFVSFMNTYRYTDGSFICTATDLTYFREQLMLQKRIEFWGEGIIYFDYKRLNMQVLRSYNASNFPSAYQIDSNPGYCAKWFNLYIPTTEVGRNTAIIANPDPSV